MTEKSDKDFKKSSKSKSKAKEMKGTENNESERLTSLEVQVGGRHSQEGKENIKLGIFDLQNGLVLKGLCPPPRGPRELNFYRQVFCPDCNDPDLLDLRQFIPQYHGSEERENTLLLKLNNLTAPFHKPCIMDIKIGRITYDQNASAEKILVEDSKFPPAKTIGFTITGMIIQNKNGKRVVDKHYTRKLTEKTVVTDGLGLFFRPLRDNAQRRVIQGLITRLQKLETWFSKQRKLSFIASSLLFIYEGMHACDLDSLSLHQNSCNAWDKNEKTNSQSDTTSSSKLNEIFEHRYDEQRLDGNHQIAEDRCAVVDECSYINTSQNLDTKVNSEQNLDKLPVNFHGPSRTNCVCDDTVVEPDINNEEIPKFSAHLIDFAHVFPSSDLDENFLFGLQSLISLLQQILNS